MSDRVEYVEDSYADVGGRRIPTKFRRVRTSQQRGPAFAIDWEVVDGQAECTRVTLERVAGGREVQSGDLRVSLRDLLEETVTNLPRELERDGQNIRSTDLRGWREAVSAVRASRRGRPRMADDQLAEVARIYLEAERNKERRTVEEALGVAERTARLYIQRAREAGLLDG